ncbi:MAG: hypothetical protein HYY01_02205 [Chloroflexi bacterium]|nr:hypothetical protein [Chloroflexota bacterium]
MNWSESVSLVIRFIAVPYGYTLAIWSAGMLAVGRYGHPRGREVLLFVTGAILGYLSFDLLALGTGATVANGRALPNTALFNVLPLLPPIAVALLAREIKHRALGFFAMGLGATVVYVASMALVVRLTA